MSGVAVVGQRSGWVSYLMITVAVEKGSCCAGFASQPCMVERLPVNLCRELGILTSLCEMQAR